MVGQIEIIGLVQVYRINVITEGDPFPTGQSYDREILDKTRTDGQTEN